jgi:hypothetical protein
MEDKLIILGRSVTKYIDNLGIEYYLNGEMIVDKDYYFVVWSDTIQPNISEEKRNTILKRIKELSKGKIKIE